MLSGWLVVNQYLKSAKFDEIHQWLLKAAQLNGVQLQRKTNAQLLIDLQDDSTLLDRPAFVLFWDKDILLARFLESQGLRLYNRAQAIEDCDDKRLTHLKLYGAGLPMPPTILAPMTYDTIGYTDLDFVDQTIDRFGLPLIIKAARGSFGQQVFLAQNRQAAAAAVRSIGTGPIVLQKYIKESAGQDFRLQVVGDRVIGAMRRWSPTGDHRANLTLGGKMEAWEPTDMQTNLAVQACRVLNLDFGGVDLLTGKNGQPLVCEVNSNAHFKTLYECTGVDSAQAIIRYIKQQQNGVD